MCECPKGRATPEVAGSICEPPRLLRSGLASAWIRHDRHRAEDNDSNHGDGNDRGPPRAASHCQLEDRITAQTTTPARVTFHIKGCFCHPASLGSRTRSLSVAPAAGQWSADPLRWQDTAPPEHVLRVLVTPSVTPSRPITGAQGRAPPDSPCRGPNSPGQQRSLPNVARPSW